MSFFAKFNRPGTTPITPQKYTVKTVKIASEPKPTPKTTPPNKSTLPTQEDTKVKRGGGQATPFSSSHLNPKNLPSSSRKRKHVETNVAIVKRAPSSDLLKPPSPESLPSSRSRNIISSSRSPLSVRLESSDEDSSCSEDARERASKRYKSVSPAAAATKANQGRKFVNPLSFRRSSSSAAEDGYFIHAEQIANVDVKSGGKNPTRGMGTTALLWRKKYAADGENPSFQETRAKAVTCQAPVSWNITIGKVGMHLLPIMSTGITLSLEPELSRYQLVKHIDADEFNPLVDILTTMEYVAKYLLTAPHSDEIFPETSGGIVYSLRRAHKRGDATEFQEGLEKYNKLLRRCRKDGTFKTNIANMKVLPFSLVEHILAQTYARTVAPKVDTLKEYEAFSSTVYGELLPKFTSKLFKDAGLTRDKVFVDLGSGTGNVVLHAALEIGCESWGCEIMPNAIALANKQQKEFEARCRMWGINPGMVRLEKGDFLENRQIANVLQRADVLLVNNYVFDSNLNQRLLDMFLDLKEGTKIISLKPFVPANHVITMRNAGNPVSRLRMEEKEYFSNSVSWTDAGGKYYVQTVDETMLRDFNEKERNERR